MRLFFRLVPLVLLLTSFAPAQSRVDCSSMNSHILNQPVHYCVLLPAGYDAAAASHSATRYAVLYFLHGLGNNEQTLFNSGGWGVIDDLRQQYKIGDFLVVAPEGKSSFYINSADGKVLYDTFFVREFMPYIESKYLIKRDRKFRGITGLSMGGYGALHMAFAHPELFSSVSAQSAALMTSTPAEMNSALHSGMPLARLLGPVFGQPVNMAHWRENDPVVLARKHQVAIRKLAIYFNCGRSDEYGFEKGAQALHRELESEHIPHEFHLYPGDHSLDYFLDHLSETMEFHSHAFQEAK
jgi:S-formylglutathione hydrolase FrmB